jgi:hypothetical protein
VPDPATKCPSASPSRVRDAQGGRDLNGDVESLTEREPRGCKPSSEGVARDVLHGEVVLAFGFAERVNRADVRVIERRRGASLLLEADDASGITVRSAGRSLRATFRPRHSSVASHTSPMPPAPMRATTS